MDQPTIGIEGNIDDRLPSMRHLVERLLPLRGMNAGSIVWLELSGLRYIGPDGIALLAGAVLDARQRGVTIQVRTPQGTQALEAFFAFSGFNHLILGDAPPEEGHPENVTVPVRRFEQSRHGDPEPIIRLIERFEPVSQDLRLSLEISVNECVQNIEDHSHSPIGGIGCARYMKRDREIRVALIDWGEGVLHSLRRQHPDTANDEHALRRVLYGGFSARSRANNLGRGIDNLRSVVTDAFGGSLYIISGNGAVDVRGRHSPRYQTWPCRFEGTAVCFTLPVQPRDQ